jgi:ATP-dependent Clp protease ATP-binding subunit ClpA
VRALADGVHLSPDAVRARYPQRDDVPASAELPLADDAKKILAYASSEAEQRQHRNVSPHHLLLAILRVPECEAAVVLAEHGLEYDVASEAVRVMEELARVEQREPVELRESHHQMLAAIARAMTLPPTRERLVLALFDALAASGIHDARFHDADAFASALAEVIAARWPPSS